MLFLFLTQNLRWSIKILTGSLTPNQTEIAPKEFCLKSLIIAVAYHESNITESQVQIKIDL